MSFPCLGFLFLGPTDGQGTQSATQRAFELAEERIADERMSGLRVEA